ncbi:glutamate-cysteine ligase family protein [Mangrovihabitans endophyticus]|uniref:Glutamate--cysteine ligase n=1 Tax=Mangrovihabitans endophyticus TaxID=1751298 RepID=A0A8J3BZR3_9ACTN|nr:glutamate-cysteine ligase family protein [Mangrovihabitans endophyticus]GGK94656.1 hypothetical protein GCM10012284_30870 [Mangrovihabitans endophyticus]
MGKALFEAVATSGDRSRYREKVHRCLDVLASMLNDAGFTEVRWMTGLEIEINLMDAAAEPAMRNTEILSNLVDPGFQPELGQFNVEYNAAPRLIQGDGLADYECDILDSLRAIDDQARKAESTIVLIGSLPTLTADHLVLANLSPHERYRALNDEIVGARGELLTVDIRGVERLRAANDSIATEAACTSAQFHLQVPADRFAAYWNASQAIAAVQVALGANSPFLFGRHLWAETRVALFQQATDTRPEELRAQGVRPRVWFGERWITSVFDLFEENVRYFPPLLPVLGDEDPARVLRDGGVPHLAELRLHNGTVYRWNRPVYDVMEGVPHLRVENRVLPSGPTVADMLANAAFYFGLCRRLAEQDRPVWSQLPFGTAEDNFLGAARHGIEATVVWPRLGEIGVTDLVLSTLLPLAHEGLDRFGVAPAHRDRLLGIIEQRCRTRRNGAWWQAASMRRAEQRRHLDRTLALHDMLTRYAALQQSNDPVHTWPVE